MKYLLVLLLFISCSKQHCPQRLYFKPEYDYESLLNLIRTTNVPPHKNDYQFLILRRSDYGVDSNGNATTQVIYTVRRYKVKSPRYAPVSSWLGQWHKTPYKRDPSRDTGINIGSSGKFTLVL